MRRPGDNALVLYGQRRIGKTSVLEQLAAWLPREGPYRTVYLDLLSNATNPLDRVLRFLARTIAGSFGQAPPDLGRDPATAFRERWLPELLASLVDDTSLVFLFDELDALAEPGSKLAGAALLPYLRSILNIDPTKLQFVFVLGRSVEDLDTIALSVFKGMDARQVSFLGPEDTTELVRLSQANATLEWEKEAVARVFQLTNGHPYLTQQLCSCVWEQAHGGEPKRVPAVVPADVDAVIENLFEASHMALEWLWHGLGPAERMVASVLAEGGPLPVTLDEIERRLQESGVRVMIRDLRNAPRNLQDWDILEPAGGGLCFRVELVRRWLVAYKLNPVSEELNHVEPVAQNLYQAALGLYRRQKLEEAVAPLRQALGLNPNHQGATQLLADILVSQGELVEGRQLLERIYAFQPAWVRSRLVQVLLLQAQEAESEDDRLALCEQILDIDPSQPEAAARRRMVLLHKGDRALRMNDPRRAIEAFELAGETERVAQVREEIDRLRVVRDGSDMINPFFYGTPIPSDLFVGREKELKRIVSRIRNRGQSSAVVGPTRSGKTSLLHYFEAPENGSALQGEATGHLLFSYLDAQGFDRDFTLARFWEQALRPLYHAAISPFPDSDLALAYKHCVENRFGVYSLGLVLAEMRREGWRLVLMLDEIDRLLHHPVLASAEFFGSLRSLASRGQGALALLIASRRSLAQLNEATQELNRTGSPYFNFLDEITLGPLTAAQVARLLEPASHRFTEQDYGFVVEVGGGHPYLLHVTASALWDAYYDEEGITPKERWRKAGQAAHDQAALAIADTWRLWPPATRKVFTGISLAHLSTLAEGGTLQDRSFDVESLILDLRNFGPERRSLQKQGLIAEDQRIPGGFRVVPLVYLWWMAEEVIRIVRSDKPLAEWLRAQEWGELMTRSEKERLSGVLRSLGDVVKTGATSLIEAAAKGIGSNLSTLQG